MINVFQPSLDLEELLAVAKTFQSNWIGKGDRVSEFEYEFAKYLNVSADIVSTNSATEALFQIFEQLNMSYFDEVIIPSIHFIGAANAIIANGGKPIFCDVDPATLNTSIEHIEPLVTGKTIAVVLLHYGGNPCDVQPIIDKLGDKGIFIIEDAACALGATYKGKPVGTIGDFGVWSFDAMKTITCGDGGMLYSSHIDNARYARESMYLGMNQSSGLESDNNQWWKFEVKLPGRRSIMNDISASIGLEQLKKLPEYLGKRAVTKSIYEQHLGTLPILPDCTSGHSFYWIQTPYRDELAHYLREHDIYTTFRYWPCHKALGYNVDLPNTEKAARETLLLPLHQSMSYHDTLMVVELVQEFLRGKE